MVPAVWWQSHNYWIRGFHHQVQCIGMGESVMVRVWWWECDSWRRVWQLRELRCKGGGVLLSPISLFVLERGICSLQKFGWFLNIFEELTKAILRSHKISNWKQMCRSTTRVFSFNNSVKSWEHAAISVFPLGSDWLPNIHVVWELDYLTFCHRL